MKSFIQYITENFNPVDVDVYHGSGRKFDKFDQSKGRIKNDFYGGGVGYFTDDKDVAHTYARSMSKETKTPHVYHTNIKMSNVFDVDHDFVGEKLQKVLPDDLEKFARGAGLLKLGADKYKVLNDLKTGKALLKGHQVFKGLSAGGVNSAEAREHLSARGYDGLRYNGGDNMGAKKHNVYIPYNANSIKINHVEEVKKPA